jgi:SAM-dependent methyltransferase
VSGPTAKYDALAPAYSETTYANPDLFYRRRAALVAELGGTLHAGARILELGCADGGLSSALVAAGFEVQGVDLSARMIGRAQQRVAGPAQFSVGELNAFEPAEAVAATIGFRVLPYVEEPAVFFARVARFSTQKLVFDLVPSTGPTLDDVTGALHAAGLHDLSIRAWLLPARTHLPAVLLPAVSALERSGPLARAITRHRFSIVVAVAL